MLSAYLRLTQPLRDLWQRHPRRNPVLREWSAQASAARFDDALQSKPVRRLAVLPSYPPDVFGSRGDEAMITAAVGALAHVVPNLRVGLFVPDAVRHDRRLEAAGFQLLRLNGFNLGTVGKGFTEFGADGCLVIGADIMDGYYSLQQTLFSLAVADLAARRGMKSAISGFSFNTRPDPLLAPAFERLHREVAVNLRDPISLGRFRSFCSTPAESVADIAFLLEPDRSSPHVEDLREWALERRTQGDVILGVNVHPMLVGRATAHSTRRITTTMTEALGVLLRRDRLSVVLLSHDYRGDALPCDDDCLAVIEAGLRPEFGDRIRRPTERLSAAEIKAIAGCLDGVVTGRMHLAIASLGMGVPVAGIAYQDKFEGLFQLVGIPLRFLLSPADLDRPEPIVDLIGRFLLERGALQARVSESLARVMPAATANLEAFLDAGSDGADDRGRRCATT